MAYGGLLLLLGCQAVAPVPPLPAWQSPQGHERAELGLIRDQRSGASLTPAQLVEQLAAASRVLVGEQHDNPDHHALQLWLLQALATRRAQGSVLLEMLNPDQQVLVERTRTAIQAGHPPADLPAALAWQPGWDWALYGPLVNYALAQPYPVQSANLDRAEITRIYAERPTLPPGLSTRQSVRAALQAQITESHCGLLPAEQLPAMLAVQQQRDRRMAERLRTAPEPALLLAGAFHVRRDLGVPLHLADLRAEQGSLVLQLVEVGQSVPAGSADFVWFTAAQPEQDYCSAMRAAAGAR